MALQKVTLNGQEFTTEPLEPFGEIWAPTSSIVDVLALLKRDIQNIVETIRSRQLLVFQNTKMPNCWNKVRSESPNCIPHLDSSNDIILLHMLYAEGSRKPTSYTTQKYMEDVLRDKLPFLERLAQRFSSDVCRRWQIDFNPIMEAIKNHQLIDFDMLFRRIKYAQQSCSFSDDATELRQLYFALEVFALDVAKDVRKYTHVWEDNPNTTVVAYQDHRAIAEEDGVYHFASDYDIIDNQNLHRNLLGLNMRGEYNFFWR